jgi:hypothetical protein
MKYLKYIVLAVLVVGLTGCSAFRNKFSKGIDALAAKDYRVTLYSGGQAVKVYEVTNTFINTEEDSDGYFFYSGGRLVRVTGDLLIEEM